jgi:hypothetical protein
VDDAPLYLFDSKFVDTAPEAFGSGAFYDPPDVIVSPEDDLFSLLGERDRPEYRWLVHGPARSGSCFHVDPNGTSAWNAVVRGAKRWILFPPDLENPPPGVHPSRDGAVVAQPVTLVEWYAGFYEHAYPGSDSASESSEVSEVSEEDRDPADPDAEGTSPRGGNPSKRVAQKTFLVATRKRTKKKRRKTTTGASRVAVEGTCYPGDVLFVPSGWWHAALNLEETAAVTQNFCSPRTAARVLRFLKSACAGDRLEAVPALVSGLESREQRARLYERFLRVLREKRPDVLLRDDVARVLAGGTAKEANDGNDFGDRNRRDAFEGNDQGNVARLFARANGRGDGEAGDEPEGFTFGFSCVRKR